MSLTPKQEDVRSSSVGAPGDAINSTNKQIQAGIDHSKQRVFSKRHDAKHKRDKKVPKAPKAFQHKALKHVQKSKVRVVEYDGSSTDDHNAGITYTDVDINRDRLRYFHDFNGMIPYVLDVQRDLALAYVAKLRCFVQDPLWYRLKSQPFPFNPEVYKYYRSWSFSAMPLKSKIKVLTSDKFISHPTYLYAADVYALFELSDLDFMEGLPKFKVSEILDLGIKIEHRRYLEESEQMYFTLDSKTLVDKTNTVVQKALVPPVIPGMPIEKIKPALEDVEPIVPLNDRILLEYEIPPVPIDNITSICDRLIVGKKLLPKNKNLLQSDEDSESSIDLPSHDDSVDYVPTDVINQLPVVEKLYGSCLDKDEVEIEIQLRHSDSAPSKPLDQAPPFNLVSNPSGVNIKPPKKPKNIPVGNGNKPFSPSVLPPSAGKPGQLSKPVVAPSLLDDPNDDTMSQINMFMNTITYWRERVGLWPFMSEHTMSPGIVDVNYGQFDVRPDTQINCNMYHKRPLYSIVRWKSNWIVTCFGFRLFPVPLTTDVCMLKISLELASQLLVASNYDDNMAYETIIRKINAATAVTSSINIDRTLPLGNYHIHRDTASFTKNLIHHYFYERGRPVFRFPPGLLGGGGPSDTVPGNVNYPRQAPAGRVQKFGFYLLGFTTIVLIALDVIRGLRCLSVLCQLLYLYLTQTILNQDSKELLIASLDLHAPRIILLLRAFAYLCMIFVGLIYDLCRLTLMLVLKLGSLMRRTLCGVSRPLLEYGKTLMVNLLPTTYLKIAIRGSNRLLKMSVMILTNTRELLTVGLTILSAWWDLYFTPLKHIFLPPSPILLSILRLKTDLASSSLRFGSPELQYSL